MKQADYIDQRIVLQADIAGNSTDEISVTLPNDISVFLSGYGYSYHANSVYQLRTGQTVFPQRTDQEGSMSTPVRYGVPFPCSQKISLLITNNNTASKQYTVVFLIATTRLLNQTSTGGELIVQTNITNTQNLFEQAVITVSSPSSMTGIVQNTFSPSDITELATAINGGRVVNYDLGESIEVDIISYAANIASGTSGTLGFTIEYGDNGSDWTVLYSQKPTTASEVNDSGQIAGETARYWRFTFTVVNTRKVACYYFAAFT